MKFHRNYKNPFKKKKNKKMNKNNVFSLKESLNYLFKNKEDLNLNNSNSLISLKKEIDILQNLLKKKEEDLKIKEEYFHIMANLWKEKQLKLQLVTQEKDNELRKLEKKINEKEQKLLENQQIINKKNEELEEIKKMIWKNNYQCNLKKLEELNEKLKIKEEENKILKERIIDLEKKLQIKNLEEETDDSQIGNNFFLKKNIYYS